MTTLHSKKRKRGADDTDKVSFKLSTDAPSHIGPVLASFPALHPPKSTAFQCWKKHKNADDDDDELFALQDTLIAGEADTVEFYTSAESAHASAGCSYLVGIHDKRTNTTTLRPAPLHLLTREVKALKNLAPMAAAAAERVQDDRNKLGEAFGTKKAKAAIRARERNRVDVDAMRGLTSHLQDTILANTGSLPTQEEAKASADSNRLIPAHNVDAQRPEDVYPLHNIVPEAEFNALSIKALQQADPSERPRLLPHSRSNWVNQHLRLLSSAPKLNKLDTKVLLYISTLFAFKAASRLVGKKDELQTRLGDVPGIVVDGLLSRFTEAARSTSSAQMTPQSETMLLTHMFALCLRIDDYASDTTLIAHDLSMPVEKVNTLFKSLGCKIEKLDHHGLKRLGLPDSAGETKRAVLKVPVVFPQVRQRRTRR